ncbi:hypothetical protein FRC03_003568 [Tulasnella sp. 419]|nr:hypothetical protein FRC03_003568 [Tulasnella sp. 419]
MSRDVVLSVKPTQSNWEKNGSIISSLEHDICRQLEWSPKGNSYGEKNGAAPANDRPFAYNHLPHSFSPFPLQTIQQPSFIPNSQLSPISTPALMSVYQRSANWILNLVRNPLLFAAFIIIHFGIFFRIPT